MDNIFNKISISLIVLGVVFYFIANTFTALIPSILGALMQVILLMGRQFPSFHKHFAHVNMLVLLLGMGATYGSVLSILSFLFNGVELERPLAAVEQFTTFILCLVGMILGVKSFIDARK